MSLEKIVEEGKIAICESGDVQINNTIIILENGEEIARGIQRYVLRPGDNLEGETERVRAIIERVHTGKFLEAYQMKMALVKG
jgi:hypothetical protein